jgi:hypothetical protein
VCIFLERPAAWCKGKTVFVDGDDPAVAEDGEVVTQRQLGDLYLVQEIRPDGAVQGFGERSEDGIVVLRVGPELRDGLCDEDVEPVERLGLVGIDLVVGFVEDGVNRECRRGGAKDGGFLLGEGRGRGGWLSG